MKMKFAHINSKNNRDNRNKKRKKKEIYKIKIEFSFQIVTNNYQLRILFCKLFVSQIF